MKTNDRQVVISLVDFPVDALLTVKATLRQIAGGNVFQVTPCYSRRSKQDFTATEMTNRFGRNVVLEAWSEHGGVGNALIYLDQRHKDDALNEPLPPAIQSVFVDVGQERADFAAVFKDQGLWSAYAAITLGIVQTITTDRGKKADGARLICEGMLKMDAAMKGQLEPHQVGLRQYAEFRRLKSLNDLAVADLAKPCMAPKFP